MTKNKGIHVKILALLVVAMLLVGCTIGGTFAWLMTRTDPVVNTFTVGDVSIELKEHVLDPSTGQWKNPEEFTTTGNSGIAVIPGRQIPKDPTVTVLKGSEPCYVRVLVKINWSKEADGIFDAFDYQEWIGINNNWNFTLLFNGATAHNNGTYYGFDIYEMRYKSIVDAQLDNVVLPVMTHITFPSTLEVREVNSITDAGMTFIAQAIQADGFNNADAAFAEAGYPEGWDPEKQQAPDQTP